MYYYTLFGIAAAILTPYQFINWPGTYTVDGQADSSQSSTSSPTSTRSISTGSIKALGTEAQLGVGESDPLTVYLTSVVRLTVQTANDTERTIGTQTTAIVLPAVVQSSQSQTAFATTSSSTQVDESIDKTTYVTHCTNCTILAYSLHLNHTPEYSVETPTRVTTNQLENSVSTTPSSSVGSLETTLYLTPSVNGTASPYKTAEANYGAYLAPCLLLVPLMLLC